MHCSNYSQIQLNIVGGIPPHDFFGKAWASEPLTGVLTETNIPFALPMPDEDLSLVAMDGQEVVGQCSANRVVKYWNHINTLDTRAQNLSTQVFVRIHQRAVELETRHLEALNESDKCSFHSAGIAVLPEYRGQNIGLTMRARQIELCRKHQATTLFCETTNRFSAATVQGFNFTKVAEFPYSLLARELSHPSLTGLNDSFSVWCLKV